MTEVDLIEIDWWLETKKRIDSLGWSNSFELFVGI